MAIVMTRAISMTILYTTKMQLKMSKSLLYRERGLEELIGHQTTWNRVMGLAERPMVTVVMQDLISP